MIENLRKRESGERNDLKYFIENRRINSLGLSRKYDFADLHNSVIKCCDLDPVENRYLLSGGGDGVVGIHDLHQRYNNNNSASIFKLVASMKPQKVNKYSSINTVQWYPQDTGMFLSSGDDKFLKIWDSNTVTMATQFKFSHPIISHKMSPSLLLVAVCNQQQIQLVDMKSGSCSQKLNGSHCDDVSDVCWSPTNQRQLISAGKDGALIMWDTRRLKSFCYKFKQGQQERSGGIVSMILLPDLKHLLSIDCRGSLRLWDITKACSCPKRLCHVPYDSDAGKIGMSVTLNHAFIPSHKHVIVVNLQTGEMQRRLAGHLDRVTNVVELPPYHDLITTSFDHNILYWQADPVVERLSSDGRLVGGTSKRKRKTIDYFSYNADEYYTGEHAVWSSDEDEEEEDRILKLLQDYWSDVD